MKPFDENGAFRPAADVAGVRRLAIRGAGVTVLSQVLGGGVQLISTVILARLLVPVDFGVVTMVTTFSLLLVSFGLNGFTEAVIQWDEINQRLISNLFWINVGVGLLLTIVFAAGGTLLALFYRDPRVTHVAVGISLTIFVTSVSVQHLALLKRAMRFTAVSVNDILARFVSVVLAIFLAWAGWGYWALVAAAIAQPLSTAIGAWILCPWIPGLPRREVGTASMVRFAMNIYARFSVNYFARNMDNLLVGWRFDAQSLGFYKKAYDLFALPASQLVSPLYAVAVSALSRLNRDSIQYRRYLLNAIAIMAFLGMGLAAALTLVGKDLIRILLGPKWEPASRIFTFFGPGIGVMLLYGTSGWIHLSLGKVERWFRWGLIEFVVTGLLFMMGLRWGPAGIAIAWTTSFWVLTIPAFWYAGKPIQLGVAPIIGAVWRYVLASVFSGCVSAMLAREIPSLVVSSEIAGAATHLLTTLMLFGVLYISAVVILHRGWTPIHQVVRLLHEMIPWGPFAGARPAIEVLSPTSTERRSVSAP